MFEYCSGSVIGAAHRKKGINNQDSSKIHIEDGLMVAIVSDGCSAGGDPNARSDVGSALLAEMTSTSVFRNRKYLCNENFFEILFQDVCDRVDDHLRNLRLEKGSKLRQAYVSKYLQATIVGCIFYRGKAFIFSCGDGLFFVNGEQTTIAPQEGNMPVYLCYKFMDTVLSPDVLEKELKFHVHKVLDLKDVESILIGTDGVQELIDAEKELIQVRNEPIGPITQWWNKDLYFTNPFAPSNWLRMMNEGGYFSDDVTLISIRRKKEVANG